MPDPDATIAGFDRSARISQAAIRALVLEAIDQLREGIRRAEIDAALEQRSPVPIFESAAWAAFGDTLAKIFATASDDAPLLRTMKSAARRALRTTPVVDAGAFSFDPVFERAIEWLEREGARLVTVVSDSTRAAIRKVVQDAFAEPLGVRQAARRILDIKGFGLNQPQTASFEKFVRLAINRQLPGAEDATGKQIQRLIDVRYRKMLRQRARLIAKTESYNAAAAAQRELWSEAVNQNQLDAERYVLEWVTRVIRVCPRCMALSGKIAEIKGGSFTSDPVVGGGKYNGTQIVVERPTVHPDCYCAMRVIERPKAEANAAAVVRVTLRVMLVEQARGSWAAG